MKIGIIIGSTRQGRVGAPVSQWVYETITKLDANAELVDLADHNLPFVDSAIPPSALGEKYEHESVVAWSKLVKSYDAFIIVVPEYNHGYPAVLKNAIDWLWTEWKDKPVGIVSYSGSPIGGARGAEQLKLVLSEVGMRVTQFHIAIPFARGSMPDEAKDHTAKSLTGMVAALQGLKKA